MNSQMHGTITSYGKVTRIEAHGFFLEAQGKQYFVPFADYPVFRRATVANIFEMEARFPGCFHWPTIDADIGLDALEHPEKYPLIARHNREADIKQQVSKIPLAKAASNATLQASTVSLGRCGLASASALTTSGRHKMRASTVSLERRGLACWLPAAFIGR